MRKVQTLPANILGNDYFVGDIHGNFSAVEVALKELGFNRKTDRLLSTGDLTDRGPESYRVLEFLAYPWFYPVMGNHEALGYHTAKQLLSYGRPYPIEAIKEEDENARICLEHGGDWLLNQTDEFLREFMSAVEKMPLATELLDESDDLKAVIVHAEFPKQDPWSSIKNDLQFLPDDFVFDLENRAPISGLEKACATAGNVQWLRDRKKLIIDLGLPITDQYTSVGTPLLISGHSIVMPGEGPFKIKNNRYIDHGMYETEQAIIYSFAELV